MKMASRQSCLHLEIFLLLIASALGDLYLSNSVNLYVDGSKGKDVDSCGAQIEPCKTVQFAVGRSLQTAARSAMITVASGLYTGQSIRVECKDGHPGAYVIRGDSAHDVTLTFSLDIRECNFTFSNILWTTTNSTNALLINPVASILSMHNCTFQNSRFSIVSSGSDLQLTHTRTSNCTGWIEGSPTFSVSSLSGRDSTVFISDCSFAHNRGTILSAKDLDQVLLKDSSFTNNKIGSQGSLIQASAQNVTLSSSIFYQNTGSVLKIAVVGVTGMSSTIFKDNVVLGGSLIEVTDEGLVDIDDSSFLGTYGTAVAPVLNVKSKVTKVDIKRGYFGCNKVNSSMHAPPMNSKLDDQISCHDCTTDQGCPVFCPAGSYLKQSILCVSCPKGTYSSGNKMNFTTLACKRCLPGHFNANPGSSRCQPCKAGTYTGKHGSTVCTPCKNDLFTSGKGQASCSKMSTGFLMLTVCYAYCHWLPGTYYLCVI
ncbi:uncharacterized protein LOC5508242 isoform X2 [Nematostella vectensis]|uniref:uncharacterized protein LOC5508242 isoform X2 n=1 Tax=Nematostella vectensis TaxID=45351 RepID=UPI0020774717|nr:uncharacterized protein LOC5508242 isoform X2 [Nematostella vectensis]